MLYNILQKTLIKNKDGTFKVRDELLSEEGISYKIEKDLMWIFFSNKTWLIPLTKKGIDILCNTYNFIYDLFEYERDFQDVIEKYINKGILRCKQLDDFYEIVDTYKELKINWVNEEDDILTFDKVEEYKCTTRIQIYSLAKLEILIRILNQNLREEDIKKLCNNDYTPIIFPIPNRNYEDIEYNFYTEDIELSGLIHTGYLQLNNIPLENKEGNRYGKTKKNW